jgi:ribosomal protein S18 acetylase RimI-like enzyme
VIAPSGSAPSGTTPSVRPATVADLEAMTALWIEMTRHHRDLDPLFTLRRGAEATIRSLLRSQLQDPSCRILACELDREVVGLIVVKIDRAPPILREVERAEITDLGVRHDCRRRGLGRALAQAALAFVREREIGRVEVRVVVGNREGGSFWRALGFRDHVHVLQRSP